MALPSTNSRDSHAKLKVAMIPVLLCILAMVLYDPGATPIKDGDLSVKPHVAATGDNPRVGEADLAKVLAHLKKREAPPIEYEDIIHHDPFQNLPILRNLTPSTPIQNSASSPQVISAARADGLEIDTDAVEALKPMSVEELPPPESKTFDEIKAILESRTVSAVLHGPQATSAIIDARIVHVGDLLEPGVRIIEIGPTGITVRIEPE